jgi:Fe-S-cluster-containing dehydrogenase component
MNESLFLIDMGRCVGCYACSVSCKDRAGMPDEADVLRVETIEGGEYPRPTLAFRVVHCFHCASPPCVDVCPTGAMHQQEGGLVQVDADTCIGCGQCIDACPFGAVLLSPEGIAAKCDGCADEVAKGWAPTCVRACPMRALSIEAADRPLPPGRRRDQGLDSHGAGPRVAYLRRQSDPLT